tara:strand:+ start:296 stop:508 length:213 start_codon:yes stop_codon:yes gene_type:complete
MFKVEIKFNDNIIHSNYYKSLRDIANNLGMTYQQVADINCGRFNPTYINKDFLFQPEIIIQRIKNKITII